MCVCVCVCVESFPKRFGALQAWNNTQEGKH